jgi:signal peptidase II
MLPLCLSFVVALLDQVTKHWIRSRLGVSRFITVIPDLFDLRYVQNTGAAWGILEGLNHWLVPLSLIMLVVMVRYRHHFMTGTWVPNVSSGLIIGGIVGNLLDRIRLGYVVDFLFFYWRTHQFPAFNLADSAICTGVGLYVLAELLGWDRDKAIREGPRPASTA